MPLSNQIVLFTLDLLFYLWTAIYTCTYNKRIDRLILKIKKSFIDGYEITKFPFPASLSNKISRSVLYLYIFHHTSSPRVVVELYRE